MAPWEPFHTAPAEWGPYRSLVCIGLHQLVVSFLRAMELILVTQLLHSGQQVMNDGPEFWAVQVLWYQNTPYKLIPFTQLERSYS